jgi:ABC-type antimicrobial peptide transport system permease subunit
MLTSLLAGFYPATVLASYLPVTSLKGSALSMGTEKLSLRKSLIVFQFSISLVFIIAATVIGKQIQYMNKAEKGFNPNAVITIQRWHDQTGKLKILAEYARQIKGVDKVIMQGNAPMGFAQRSGTYTFKGKQDITLHPILEIGDENYIPFYQMKMISGTNISHNDSLNEIVVNETMARAMGCRHPEEVVGKMLYGTTGGSEKAFPVVGVVADFHQGSFHDAILPAVILNFPLFKESIAIRLASSEKNAGEVRTVLSQIENKWKTLFPETPFNYSFLNESIGWLYGQEEKTSWLINVSTVITIFISCMGLFGLGMFTARRRTKEIGIRKVLGASVKDITTMLSKEFIKLIGLSIVIASPIAWYFMNKWLQDYTYRTVMSWWVFALAGISAILIGLITVSYQSVKAAVANPIESLRTE